MKLELTIEQIQILGHALHQLPYGQVAPLIAEIDAQLLAQQQPKVEHVPAAKEPEQATATTKAQRRK